MPFAELLDILTKFVRTIKIMESIHGISYTLSIRIHSDGFFLSGRDESGRLLSSKLVTAPILNLPTDEIAALLKTEMPASNHKIRLIYESDVFVFVPTALFDQQETVHYLSFQHKIPKNERVAFNAIPAWDTVNVFTIPSNLLQALMATFPGVSIEHQMSSLLSDHVHHNTSTEIHLWVRSKMMDMIVLKNGKLFLLNSFPFTTPEDFVYHCMNVADQLEINNADTHTYLYNGDSRPEIEQILNNYLLVTSR